MHKVIVVVFGTFDLIELPNLLFVMSFRLEFLVTQRLEVILNFTRDRNQLATYSFLFIQGKFKNCCLSEFYKESQPVLHNPVGSLIRETQPGHKLMFFCSKNKLSSPIFSGLYCKYVCNEHHPMPLFP